MRDSVRTVGFVGKHNSGKTTFLLALLPVLAGRGLRVGYLKHAHAGFEIDQPRKDSYRARRAGVVQTIVTGGGQTAVIDDAGEAGIAEVIERYAREDLDLVVVEGFKREPLPKIEVARLAVARGPAGSDKAELVCADDALLLAVVSDFDPPRRDVPRFAMDDHRGVADLIWAKVLGRGEVVAAPGGGRGRSPLR